MHTETHYRSQNPSGPTDMIGHKRFLRLILLIIALFIICTAASALFLYFDIQQPLNTHYGAILSIITQMRESLVLTTIKIYVVSSILVVIGVLILGILYTHRIAGPHQRIKSYAKSVGDGRLNINISFRRKDATHSFAEALNTMTNRYKHRVEMLTADIRTLKEEITEIKNQAEKDKDVEYSRDKVLQVNGKIKALLKTVRL